ncbi:MAG TPA: ABC transporter ATP-binding protein [Pseudolabrys sp.]|nr:ABC transporter ATP-binding protein [Pseudolabrys sp.]
MSHITLKNAGVRLPIYDSHSLRLLRLPSFGRAKVGTQTVSHSGSTMVIHALSDVSLELADGDRVCVIGSNGAGKTTLLRVLAGIYAPTSGSIGVEGKVYAMLGNSMLLNNDATGYENIQLIANLYHWPKEQMPEFIRDIEVFTELGEYLSLPVRIYSAGMQARLAFAMGTAHSPDILLVDEGIGAGDEHFQQQAQERIERFLGTARIIVLASHSVELCRKICTKAILLSKGREVFFGDIDEAFRIYGRSE